MISINQTKGKLTTNESVRVLFVTTQFESALLYQQNDPNEIKIHVDAAIGDEKNSFAVV